MRIHLCLLGILWALAGAASADSAALRALNTADEGKGWEAVGRINFGRTGFCTGTLIAPDVVLTAAHCMFDKDTRARIAVDVIQFQAGLRNGRAAAYRGARQIYVHPDYVFDNAKKIERVASDLALIQLDQPIRHPQIKPFGSSSTARNGAEVGVVSYAQDREKAPSLEELCHILGRDPGVLVLSCQVNYGASGAPIFVEEDGEMRIVSVISAKADWKDRPVALAAALGEQLPALLAGLRDAGGVFQRVMPTIGARVRRDGIGTGAKFLKP